MKFTGNQRKLYLLALALLVVAIALACTWTLWERPSSETVSPTAMPTEAPGEAPSATPAPESILPETTASPDAAAAAESAGTAGAQTINTVVYYQDNYGYLVPVMCPVPAEEGIAKATLSKMVQSTANDMQAARLGLRTVLPENVKIDLDISKGLARIDLSKEVLNLADAAAESNMITAVVQTLTEFPTVEKVEFLIDGQQREKLTHGTTVSGQFARADINPEVASGALSLSDAQPVTLYFPGDSASVLVPVTRMVYSEPDVQTAVLELAKGPSTASPLENALPSGCGLIDVTVKDGVAQLNFTKEFIRLAENSDGGRLALKALVLTCTQFEGIRSVEIFVDGEPYDTGAETLSVPTYVNVADDLVYDYVQTQSALLFDFE